jgi:hypothetical protein
MNALTSAPLLGARATVAPKAPARKARAARAARVAPTAAISKGELKMKMKTKTPRYSPYLQFSREALGVPCRRRQLGRRSQNDSKRIQRHADLLPVRLARRPLCRIRSTRRRLQFEFRI